MPHDARTSFFARFKRQDPTPIESPEPDPAGLGTAFGLDMSLEAPSGDASAAPTHEGLEKLELPPDFWRRDGAF